ncbi:MULTISPECIES: FecR family protein [unclassified Pedobacter]|uniref:FecR family protein n=1 Tax=unclassified Pedobacter TaxID=2628915 RepID=UPI001424252E|nr:MULTISPECIES: FecR family protein [unclassified Pedobacter]NII83261.1 ferric-dicitrate binding protein FerR (iron transport regulator) [Pedobacter sp. SG908]NMN37131.1 ferric-dicitrate binding protein FerR (iron transport regulator) [Pedobacter sp. SG918]
MSRSIAVSLLKKYLSGDCTVNEIEQVDQWFDSMDAVPEDLIGLSDDQRRLVEDKIFERILLNIETKGQQKIIPIPKKSIRVSTVLWAAASLILVLGAVLIWRYHPELHLQNQTAKLHQSVHIKPGGNRAVLTLGDGSSVVLTEAKIGALADQQNVSVVKTAEGELSYEMHNGSASAKISYNKITTPLGGKYSVVLPDGSKAWLNAKSSLRFPTAFTGAERVVQMTGEVYFEVAKNPKQPFKVQSGETEIKVLGTHFNVMAYGDEAEQKTTLIEGSIHLSSGKFSQLLKPGQQALIDPYGIKVNNNCDLEAVMAWRNDLFIFKDMEIKEIARQLARWYDIQVVFRGTPSKISYTGTISKDVELSELLSMLQFTGLKYELNGHQLTIID